jgi:hypothetical protein
MGSWTADDGLKEGGLNPALEENKLMIGLRELALEPMELGPRCSTICFRVHAMNVPQSGRVSRRLFLPLRHRDRFPWEGGRDLE